MSQTIKSCFLDACNDKVEYFLEQLENENDETILEWYQDKEPLCEKLLEEFNNGDMLFDDVEQCYSTINHNIKHFQEMIRYLRECDDEYTYDGDVIKMFNLFTYKFMESCLGLGGMVMDDYIMDLICERLEELCDKINPVETQPPSDDETDEEDESDEDIEVPFNTDLIALEILHVEEELPPQQ